MKKKATRDKRKTAARTVKKSGGSKTKLPVKFDYEWMDSEAGKYKVRFAFSQGKNNGYIFVNDTYEHVMLSIGLFYDFVRTNKDNGITLFNLQGWFLEKANEFNLQFSYDS